MMYFDQKLQKITKLRWHMEVHASQSVLQDVKTHNCDKLPKNVILGMWSARNCKLWLARKTYKNVQKIAENAQKMH